METFLQKIDKGVQFIEKGAVFLASMLLIGMALFIGLDTLLRYFFNAPIAGVLELSENFIMVSLVYLCISATFAGNEHIRVDLLASKLPPKVRGLIEIVMNVIVLIIIVIVCKQNWMQFSKALQSGEKIHGAISVPIAPAYFIIIFGLSLLAIRLVLVSVKLIVNKLQWEAN